MAYQERAAGYQGRSVDGLERVGGGHRMQGDVWEEYVRHHGILRPVDGLKALGWRWIHLWATGWSRDSFGDQRW